VSLHLISLRFLFCSIFIVLDLQVGTQAEQMWIRYDSHHTYPLADRVYRCKYYMDQREVIFASEKNQIWIQI